MKQWHFKFYPMDNDYWALSYGWNSIFARGKKSAIKKAQKWVKDHNKTSDRVYQLDIKSVSCDKAEYDLLMSNFY